MLKLYGYILIAAGVLFFSTTGLAEEKDSPLVKDASIEKQISYALGYDIFEKLRETIELDPQYFFMGAKDSQGNTPQVSEKQLQDILMSYQRMARQKQIEKIKEESEKNRTLGAKFLDENKKKEGVITLSSGLQYKVLKEGTGALPKLSDTVECHYKGTLIDGTEFDSSYKRGKAATFQVGGVIPGWVEALQKMKEGSRWMLYIPSDLAYGDRGAGPKIKPGSTLIFVVELMGIVE